MTISKEQLNDWYGHTSNKEVWCDAQEEIEAEKERLRQDRQETEQDALRATRV